jgi:type IV pilus assembly protein PilY1
MRFHDGDDTAGDYNAGNIRLGRRNTSATVCTTESTSTADALGIGSSFTNIFDRINCESANSGTPLASSLNEAKLYLDAHKAGDSSKECRKKFVILITDGADTYACSGTGAETQTDQYKRRRESVAKAKALSDAGYKVFVVGFGAGMPYYLTNTLNWMAYYGGTDNAGVANSGDPTQYPIPAGSLYPSGITSCLASSYTSDSPFTHYYATSNDPGEASLSGYAFFAADASQLSAALKTIKTYIQEKSTSAFTGSAIPSVRFVDNDIVYVSSLEIPSWKGDLKAYQLNADGTLPIDATTKKITASPIWDAGVKLNQKTPSDRKIYTYLGGADKEDFKSSNPNLTKEALGVPDDINRQKIIDHVRGIDAYDLNTNGNTTEPREWKLGDMFHSNAVIVGEPSRFFVDEGFSGTGGFYQANKDRTKVVIVGANDGMLHTFNASTGVEEWGFIPNSLLKNLQSMISTHTYYVDSSPKVADVWFYSDSTDSTKSADEWKTVLICGLRKGGKTYFALNITDTLNPQYLWEFPKPTDSVTLAKVGQSWSEPVIGRVKIEVGGELYERWVAFIGGGFDYTNNTGKAFFVIDIKTGDIIKEFSGMEGMNYSFAAPPAVVDTNSDGFIDKIYIGDLGGQMWVFDVSFDGANKKSNSKWTGKRLFIAPSSDTEKHRIYYQPAVAFDRYGNPWVYFGTGDREHPNDLSNPAERFYAVKDSGIGNFPRSETDLLDVTSSNTFTPTSKDGWYIQLEKSTQKSEKVLAKPVVFNKLVYFTTYVYTTTANPCSVPGEAKLYIVEYLSGGGALEVDDLIDLAGSPSQQRSKTIGPGGPSNPVITVDVKGKASVTVGTTSDQVFSTQILSHSKSKEILYWREVIP